MPAVMVIGACATKTPIIRGSGKNIVLKAVSGPEGRYLKNIAWGKVERRKFNLTGQPLRSLLINGSLTLDFCLSNEVTHKITISFYTVLRSESY
jgi:hypothetical protein